MSGPRQVGVARLQTSDAVVLASFPRYDELEDDPFLAVLEDAAECARMRSRLGTMCSSAYIGTGAYWVAQPSPSTDSSTCLVYFVLLGDGSGGDVAGRKALDALSGHVLPVLTAGADSLKPDLLEAFVRSYGAQEVPGDRPAVDAKIASVHAALHVVRRPLRPACDDLLIVPHV